jgi:L-ascorbate metabolism protein UlaG (beta-lactamase superfamily)
VEGRIFEMVTIQLFGNACTLITAPDGKRIVSDPYGAPWHPVGLNQLPDDLEADAVTISHEHPDHNYAQAVAGEPQIITEPGTCQIGTIKVTGYASLEGSPSGPSKMRNVVFVFEIGEVKIVHLGDAGVIPEPEVRAAIANADVILVNIDGYVLPLDQLLPEMEELGARTIIPTHFSVLESARWATPETLTLEEYLDSLPPDVVVVRMGSEIQVTPGMPKQVAGLTYLLLDE